MGIRKNTISTGFVFEVIGSIDLCDGIKKELLDSLGIHEEHLGNKISYISPTQFSRLIVSLSRYIDDELLGAGVDKLKCGNFMLMAKYVVRSENLSEVLEKMNEYYSAVSNSLIIEVKEDVDVEFAMHLKTKNDADFFVIKILYLLVFHRFMGWLLGVEIKLNKFGLDFDRRSLSKECEILFPCSVEYLSEISFLSFSSEYLDCPVIRSVADLDLYFKEIPLIWFIRQEYRKSISFRVHELILKDFSNEIDMSFVASELGFSVRTLRRRLEMENTSFQQIKDGARLDLAVSLLTNHKNSITEISCRLGFSDAPSFSRAFKKWTGLSPYSFRLL